MSHADYNGVTQSRLNTSSIRKMLTRNFALAEFIKPEETTTFKRHPMQVLYESRLALVAFALQQVRDELGMPLVITSGWRSKERNVRIGGSPTSDHPSGWAADVKCPFISADKLAACFVSAEKRGLIKFDQLIIYPWHVHVSVNPRFRGQVFNR